MLSINASQRACRELVQKDAHVWRTCVGMHPSYTSSRSPLNRNKWCCLPSVRSRSSESWDIACAASRQHTTWPRPSLNEYRLGTATSACTWESRCTSEWFIRKAALSAVDCLCSKPVLSTFAADAVCIARVPHLHPHHLCTFCCLSPRGTLGSYADEGLGTHCDPCARHMLAAVSRDTQQS